MKDSTRLGRMGEICSRDERLRAVLFLELSSVLTDQELADFISGFAICRPIARVNCQCWQIDRRYSLRLLCVYFESVASYSQVL